MIIVYIDLFLQALANCSKLEIPEKYKDHFAIAVAINTNRTPFYGFISLWYDQLLLILPQVSKLGSQAFLILGWV